MRFIATVAGCVTLLGASPALAQDNAVLSEPFKLGTFQIDVGSRVGIVLQDRYVIELDRGNEALQVDPTYARVSMPADMLELIGQYEYGLKHRIYEIVTAAVTNNRLSGQGRPVYIHDVADVRTLAPILYPGKILNAAGNFYSHVCEGCTPEEQAESDREHRENRGIPYLFLKPSRGAVIGNGESVVIPPGRDRIDWEVEFGTVIGRPASYVSATEAQDYVFGYMVTIDISDRGGRPEPRSDWFVGKGHDSFAPQGPWIVPKEFYGDPMSRLHQQLTIDGVTVQEARAGDMIHSIWELMEYASSIITLYPGDVLNSGTSGGTSSGAFAEGTRSGYLQAGEVIEASIEGIGTLRMPTVAGDPLPDDLTGAELPPVSSYRDPR
ncbi:MAG TPA: fumarylacetoacetate hydrolase family protein [Vicinamibacterales bacterium]|jgi:2-keto-4-pentenoate hydratase/2-oxohepta-3-ene-1,7-dioic acid hydratase in catechol pathway|nr:fumarylacetoacetate hydrolase family protein [Dehalococcoidia bacterium]HJN45056.1 fumarylacetoacetate hydrolase family protein [Vicinamibacterales bacterium]